VVERRPGASQKPTKAVSPSAVPVNPLPVLQKRAPIVKRPLSVLSLAKVNDKVARTHLSDKSKVSKRPPEVAAPLELKPDAHMTFSNPMRVLRRN
jgi:hypothetical protein